MQAFEHGWDETQSGCLPQTVLSPFALSSQQQRSIVPQLLESLRVASLGLQPGVPSAPLEDMLDMPDIASLSSMPTASLRGISSAPGGQLHTLDRSDVSTFTSRETFPAHDIDIPPLALDQDLLDLFTDPTANWPSLPDPREAQPPVLTPTTDDLPVLRPVRTSVAQLGLDRASSAPSETPVWGEAWGSRCLASHPMEKPTPHRSGWSPPAQAMMYA